MAVYRAGQIVTDAELNTGTAQVDLTAITCNTTSSTNCSKTWDIPPNAAQGGSSWRLTTFGKLQMGTTADATSWYMGIGPSAATTVEIVNAAGGDIPASDLVHWIVIIHFVVNVAGASGTCSVWGTMEYGDLTTHELTWTNGAVASFNSTVDNQLSFVFSFGSITGSPTLTSYLSIFERMS